jgi:lysophospholipase L1-like esterase
MRHARFLLTFLLTALVTVGGFGAASHRSGVALSGVSHVDGIAKAMVASINGTVVTAAVPFIPFLAATPTLSDAFTRADSAAGGVGNSWEDAGNNWKVTSGKLEAVGGTYLTDVIFRPASENLAHPKVSARVSFTSSGGFASAMLWIRASVGNGYVAWLGGTPGAEVLALGKMSGGALVDFTTSGATGAPVDSDYILTLEGFDGVMTAKVSAVGAPQVAIATANYSDGAYATGRVGASPLKVGVTVDDFTVVDLSQSGLLVCDGNSMTSGFGLAAGQDYPAQLAALIGPGWTVVNLGVSGQTTEAMSADAVAQVDSLFSASRAHNFALAWEATNDAFFGANAANTIAHLKTYCAGRKAAGFTVGVLTVLPRSEVGTPGDFETTRATVNTEIRNPGNLGVSWDAVIDVAAEPNLQDETDPIYFQDLVHPTADGAAIVASVAATTESRAAWACGSSANRPARPVTRSRSRKARAAKRIHA